jgi:hypothetical protein
MNAGLKRHLLVTLGTLFLLLVTQQTSRADTISVNTTSLQGNASGPFVLGFVLIDASLSGDGNNTVMLSNFAFGGGSAGMTFTDSDPSGFNFITSAFIPGTVLSFNLAMTANPDLNINPSSGLPGDQFLFVILDSTGQRIQSTDNNTPDAFAVATIGSGGLSVQQFSIPASTSVPEPATVLLLGSGLVLGLRCKRRHSS